MCNVYFFLFALVILSFASCESNTDIDADTRDEMVRRHAETYYQQHAPLDNGYEFVELTVIDTIYFKDNIEYRRNSFQAQLERNKNMLEIAKLKQDTFPTVNFQGKMDKYQSEIYKIEQILDGIDRLEADLGEKANDVASYTYRFKCRANDGKGQKVLQEFLLQTDAGYGILNFTPDSTELFPNPNDFPGYRDMAKAVLIDGKFNP